MAKAGVCWNWNACSNELGEPDASGRRKPVAVEGSNFRIPADVMVIAIGQSPSPLISKSTPDLALGKGASSK